LPTKGKLHIRTGDTVFVISGKEKGKRGKVIRVLKKEEKAIIEKLNVVKRHSRPTQKNPTSGIIEKESGIHISNLMVYDPSVSGPARIGRRVLASGEKVRFSKKSGEDIKG
jgi:large subunit ribosomal protein L24